MSEFPYGGAAHPNSGHAGSETSRARAESNDADGTTSQRQRDALSFLAAMGSHGATWKEYSQASGLHHGSATGVLSVLHKAGKVARLSQVRNRCKVYCLPGCVNEREVEPHGQTSATVLLDEMAEILRVSYGSEGCKFHRAAYPDDNCIICRTTQALARYEARS